MNLLEGEVIDDLDLKGLKIIQREKVFKFGIDAVLLSDFAKVKQKDIALDFCTGNGIVPILLVGKYNPLKVIGVEIQSEIANLAKKSMILNNINDKVRIIEGDLNEDDILDDIGKVDVVTVNPPYKKNSSGIENSNEYLKIARHESKCTLEDVIKASRRVLKDGGRFYMVHRPERLVDIFYYMRKYRIEPKRGRMVCPNVEKAPNIVLIEGVLFGGENFKWENNLYVYENGIYSKEIDKIYGKER